jgi:hypothetical protein
MAWLHFETEVSRLQYQIQLQMPIYTCDDASRMDTVHCQPYRAQLSALQLCGFAGRIR